jgi:uncharacterized protein with HEPN domain
LKRVAALSLLDAYDACGEIEQFLDGVTLGDFRANRPLELATERLFGIAAEALNRAVRKEPDVATRLPTLGAISALRDSLAYSNDAVDPESVWRSATFEAPVLRQEIESLLRAEDHWPDEPYLPGQ